MQGLVTYGKDFYSDGEESHCRGWGREMTSSHLFQRIPLVAVLRKENGGAWWKQGDQLEQELGNCGSWSKSSWLLFSKYTLPEHSYAHLHYNSAGESLPQPLCDLQSRTCFLYDPWQKTLQIPRLDNCSDSGERSDSVSHQSDSTEDSESCVDSGPIRNESWLDLLNACLSLKLWVRRTWFLASEVKKVGGETVFLVRSQDLGQIKLNIGEFSEDTSEALESTEYASLQFRRDIWEMSIELWFWMRWPRNE